MAPQAVVCAAPKCAEFLPADAHPNKKYCSPRCRRRVNMRTYSAKRSATERALKLVEETEAVKALVNAPRVTASESRDGRASARRGDDYDWFVAKKLPQMLIAEEITKSQLYDVLIGQFPNLSRTAMPTTVSRWMAAWREDLVAARRQDAWLPEYHVYASVNELVEALEQPVVAFTEFRARFFLTERGDPYDTPGFQKVWVEATLEALRSGGRLMILSPPRHGKTALLTHFCCWLISLVPNIRIMWVGGNLDIAKQSTSSVLDELEHNDGLREAVCGPEGSFKPATRTGKSWSSDKFTVATRTVTGIKSPTMVAVGRGGKLLSRDADLIVADDVEDFGSTVQPSAREQTRTWWNTQLTSRKEAHTAMLVIGSRQHPDDLYGHLLGNESWDDIVESAHDPGCTLPADEPAQHVACVLWPQVRDYGYLMEQKASYANDALFEMVYLNRANPEGMTLLSAEDVQRARHAGRLRRWGQVPSGCTLIAGLDPATRGEQAAVLVAYEHETDVRHVIDVDVRPAGGMPGIRAVVADWHDRYGLRSWAVERNAFQEVIFQDEDLRRYCAKYKITLKQHYTHGSSKWDPQMGVTALFALFRQDPVSISLPSADGESVRRFDKLVRQFLNFDEAVARKKWMKSDCVMATWFCEVVIRDLRRHRQADQQMQYDQTWYPATSDDVPWSA